MYGKVRRRREVAMRTLSISTTNKQQKSNILPGAYHWSTNSTSSKHFSSTGKDSFKKQNRGKFHCSQTTGIVYGIAYSNAIGVSCMRRASRSMTSLFASEVHFGTDVYKQTEAKRNASEQQARAWSFDTILSQSC